MQRKLKTALLGLGAMALMPSFSQAAPKFYFGDGKELEIFFMNQLWGIYTMDRVECGAIDNSGNCTSFTDPKNRADFLLRRSRVGFQGKINEDLSWRVWFAYDNVGLDPHTAIAQSTTVQSPDKTKTSKSIGLVGLNANNQQFYVWDALFTYSLHKNWANITVGYFRPQVGRESITAGFEVNSFEKDLTNFYPRQHLVKTGPGRETGINIGGLYNDEKAKWGINYNFGMFNTDKYKTDKNWNPLLTARVALSLGDPEMKKYGMGYKFNYFGKRNGITAAVNYAYQGKTDDFKSNKMLGFDILANYKDFNFNAEYDILSRDFEAGKGTKYSDKVWHIRAGYNFNLPNKTILEPAINYSELKADGGSSPNGNGKFKVLDVGLNWYIKQNNLKLNLHYVKQDGDAKSPYSWYGKDKAGDYVGVGLQLIF